MDANHILNKLLDKYSTCATYSDRGSTRHSDKPDHEMEFQTYFSRPDKFRFEWTDYHPYFGKSREQQHYALWSNGIQIYECYHFNDYRAEKAGSLMSAVAGATGISCGVVHTIHSLLLTPVPDAARLFGLKHFQKLPKEDSIGGGCYLIEGATRHENDTSIWIDIKDFSLRRIREDILIEEDEIKRQQEEMAQSDPAFYKEINLDERIPKDYRFVQEVNYTEVRFDGEIDEELFNGASLPHENR